MLRSSQDSPKQVVHAATPKMVSGKPPVVIEPRQVSHQVERQIKYLGLVIEKDEEYLIQEDDLQIMRIQKQNGCISRFSAKELERYENEQPDCVERKYYPIRDRYIKIVKNSRKLSIESFEKRGRKDLKHTVKNLFKIARDFKHQNQEMQMRSKME